MSKYIVVSSCYSSSCSFLSIETTEIREGTVCTWSWGFNLHLPVLIDDGFIVVSNLGLLGLIVYRIVVLIQIIQRCVFVRWWRGNFSGWWVPSILSLAETVLAFSFDVRLNQCRSSYFSMRVWSWSWQFLTSSQSLFSFW